MNIVNQDLVLAMIGFLKGHIGLDKLKLWLAESVWDLSNSESPLDRMMLGELDLALAEYDRGDRDEAYLAKHIRFLLQLPNPALVPELQKAEGL